MNTKRPFTRAEKSLFLAPLLVAVAAGGLMMWQRLAPNVITVKGADDIRSVEWSPDGRRLVVFAEFLTSPPPPGTFRSFRQGFRVQGEVFDVASRAKICDLTSPPQIFANQPLWFNFPSWSPDGKRIATGYSDGTLGTLLLGKGKFTYFNSVDKIALWNAQSGTLTGNYLYAPSNENSHAGVYFTRDGKQLVGYERPLALFDANSGRRLRRFGSAGVDEGALNRARTLVALSSSASSKFEVRDTRTGKRLWQPIVRYSTQARWNSRDVLAVIDSGPNHERRLLLWNGKSRRTLPSPPLKNVLHFALSRTAPVVAILDVDLQRVSGTASPASCVVWNFQLNRVVWSRKIENINDLAWSRDGKWLGMDANTSTEQFARIYNAQGQVRMQRSFKSLWGIRWAPDSKRLALYGKDRIEIVRVAD